MPTYYADVLGTPPSQAKLHLTLPHLASLALKVGRHLIAFTSTSYLT